MNLQVGHEACCIPATGEYCWQLLGCNSNNDSTTSKMTAILIANKYNYSSNYGYDCDTNASLLDDRASSAAAHAELDELADSVP